MVVALCGRHRSLAVAATATTIAGHVKQLCDAGVPAGKIFVGGFSQGGGTALYSALATEIATAETDFCGVFSLGSWVTSRSRMWPVVSSWEQQRPGRRRPPIFLAHGGSDGMIDPAWGEATRDEVRCLQTDTFPYTISESSHPPPPLLSTLPALLQPFCGRCARHRRPIARSSYLLPRRCPAVS